MSVRPLLPLFALWLGSGCTDGAVDGPDKGADDTSTDDTSTDDTEDTGGCDTPSTFYADTDGDGAGAIGATWSACTAPDGYVANSDDCDDADATIHPGATDACDDVDQDCDGAVDEDATWTTWYADGDGDGYGDAALSLDACATPDGYLADASDCDDADATIHPGADEPDCTDPVDYNCDGSVAYADADRDGHAACAECDDTDAAVFPGAAETCNGTDDDCDGVVDPDTAVDASTWYADTDGDAYGDAGTPTIACDAPAGTVADATDCDDTAAMTNPGALETCGGTDEDCDGTTDEPDAADASDWYADTDTDGFGDPAAGTRACDAPLGAVSDATDCDDTSATARPGGTEVCGGGDEDCDGTTDEDDAADAPTWHADTDGDGYGDPATAARACLAGARLADATDCDDTRADVFPGAAEVCDDVDNDCEGSVDEAAIDASTWYADTDGDGYGSAAATATQCDAPAGYVALATDCEDADATISPAGTEVCNTVDDDCDGRTDEGTGYTWYVDEDGDGAGSSTTAITCSATPPAGYAATATDCDDDDDQTYIGAPERCDGHRNDCSDPSWSTSDEADLVSYESADGVWTDATADWAVGTASTPVAITTPSDGVVHVCAGDWSVLLTVPSGADLTLRGQQGAATTWLDAEYDGTVITVEDDTVLLDVEGITLYGGSAATGGCIRNAGGTLTITDTIFSSCGASAAGAGIWSDGGTITIEDSDVYGLAGTATGLYGGAVYASDTHLSLTGSTVDGRSGSGGGIYWTATNDATLTIDDTTFDTTSAWYGAALYIDAGGTGAITLTGSTFDSNAADRDGGAVYLTGSGSSVVSITGTTFDNNGGDRNGGSLYADSSATLTIDDLYCTGSDGATGGCLYLLQDATITSSSLSTNGTPYATNATNYGSAIAIDGDAAVTLTDVYMRDNQVFRKGGAVYLASGDLTCERCTITGNSIVNSTSCYNGTLTGTYCSGAGIFATNGTVTLVDSDVSDNSFVTSRNTYGGGIAVVNATLALEGTTVGSNAASYGAGLFLYGTTSTATATITAGSIIEDNTATSGGGGAYLYGGALTCTDDDASGTAMFGNTGGAIQYATSGTNAVTVTGCDFGVAASADDNTSTSGSPTCDVYTPTFGWYDYGDDVSFSCDDTSCL